MLSAFPAPVLAVAADAVRDLQGREALSGLWALFSKCKDSLQDGRRLENISWRLWNRDMMRAKAGEGRVYDEVLYVGTEKPDILLDTPYRPPTPNHPPPDYSVGSLPSARSPSPSIPHSYPQHFLERRPSSIRSRRGSFLTGNIADPVSVGRIICDMLPSSSLSSSSKLSLSSMDSISSNRPSSNQMSPPPLPALMYTGMPHLADDPKIEAIEELYHQSLHVQQSSSISGSGHNSSSNSTLADGACHYGSEAPLSLPSPSLMPAAEDVMHDSHFNSARPTNIIMPEVSSGRTSPVGNLNSSRTIIGTSCLPTPEMEVGEAEANTVPMESEPSQFASSDSSKIDPQDERRPYTGPPSPSLSDSYAAAHPGEIEVLERELLPSLSTLSGSQQFNTLSTVTPSQDDTSINTEPTLSPSPTPSSTIPTLAMSATTIFPITPSTPLSTVVPPSTPPQPSSSNLSAPPQPPRLVVVNPTPNPTPHPTPPATPLIAGAIGFPHGLVHGTGAGASALLRNQWLLPPGAVAAVERSQRRRSREELNREEEYTNKGSSGQSEEQRQLQYIDAEHNHADEVEKWYGYGATGVYGDDRQEGVYAHDFVDAEGGGRADNREQQQLRITNQPNELRQLAPQYVAPLGFQRPVNRLSVSSTASSNQSNTTTASSSTNTTSDTSVEMELAGDGGSDCTSDLGSASAGGTVMPRIPSLSTIESASTLTHHHPRIRSPAVSGSGSASTPPPPIPTSPSTSRSAEKKKAKRNSAASITGGVLSLSPTSIAQSPKSPRTLKSAGPPPSAYNYTSEGIVTPGNVISATTENADIVSGVTTTLTTTTAQQKRKSITAGSSSGGIVRRASSGAGSNRSRSAGRITGASAAGREKNRSTSREPLSAGLEMTMGDVILSAGSAAGLVHKGLGMAQIVGPSATRKMGGGAGRGRGKFVLGGKLTRTKSTGGAGAGHARRTSGGSNAGLGLAKKQNSAKARKAEEEQEEGDEVDDEGVSGGEVSEEWEGEEEAVSPTQPTSKMQQQQQAILAVQAQAQQIMEEQLKLHKEMESKRAEVKREIEERKHMEVLALEARLVEEEMQRVALQQQQQLQLADLESSSFAGRRATRFNIGSNSDDGSGVGGKSVGSGSDVSPDRRGEEGDQRAGEVVERNEEQLRLQVQQSQHPYPTNVGPSHNVQHQPSIHQVIPDHHQLALEYQQRQQQQQYLILQQQQQLAIQFQQQQAAQLQQQQQQQKQKQYDEQFMRQLSKPQLAQLQKMQQLHQGANAGMGSRQGSTKQVAPPFALTQNVGKGKERQQEAIVELGRQVSTSSKGKDRNRDFVKSVSPKKPSKHAKSQARQMDAAELDARVERSLADPLLPQGNKKTIVLTSDDSEFSTDEWSSDDNDEEELRREKEQKERDVEAKKQQQMLMQHAQQLLQQQQQMQQQQQPAARPAFYRTHSSHYPAANNARGKQLTRKQAHLAVAQANTQLLVEQAARELREMQRREVREQEQRDLFKKLPSESFQNLAASRTRSVGLLTQLMNPDPTIFPPNHPYRRGYSSGEIRPPPGFAPMKPMTKVDERPAQQPAQQPPVKPEAPLEMPAPQMGQGPHVAGVTTPRHAPKVPSQEQYKIPLTQLTRTAFSPPPRTASLSKSPVAQPVSSFLHQAGSFARKAGALVGMAPLVGTGSSNGYRPKGRPQDQELESDTEGEEDQANTTSLSKSVAEEKLVALAIKRAKAAAAIPAIGTPATTRGASALPLPEGDSPPTWARASQPAHIRSQSQGLASKSRGPNSRPAPIPVGHPYNLPPAPPPSTPTTTRRIIVNNELSESLRANVIWERQVSRGPDPAVLRRTASNGRCLVPSPTVPNMVKLHAKGTINPADLPVVPNDDKEKEARKQRALQRTASLADDYHISGW